MIDDQLPAKHFPIHMPPACWKLLAMYVVNLNYKLALRDWPMLRLNRVVGALLSDLLLQNEEDIRTKFKAVQKDVAGRRFARFFDADQLAAVEAATAADIPDVLRIGWRERERAARRAERDRAVRGVAGGRTEGSIPGPGVVSAQVPTGYGHLASGDDLGSEDDRQPDSGRANDSGPGHPGVFAAIKDAS